MDRDRHSNTFRLAYIFFATYIVFAMMIAVSKETKTVEVIDKTNTEVETTTEVLVETTTEEETTEETSRANVVNYSTDGTWCLTAYCSCPQCVGYKQWELDEEGNEIVFGAEGTRLYGGYSCAADYSIPFGTQLEVTFADGTVRVLTVQDRFGSDTYHRIDLYCDSHEEALLYGRQAVKVRIL